MAATNRKNESSTASDVSDTRVRLQAHFDQEYEHHPGLWDALWRSEYLPWDKGCPNPALDDILSDCQDLIGSPISGQEKRKLALVPGCGRGYDVLLLASHGYDVVGLEVSTHAIDACRKLAASDGYKYTSQHSGGPGRVDFINGNFFEDEWRGNGDYQSGTFDLIYDYTFLSALPPDRRPSWSKRMHELLNKTGKLICVEFPTYKNPSTGGPPWGLPSSVYLAHLSHPGQEIPYNSEGYPLTDDKAETSRGVVGSAALARIAHWKPQRTHEIGAGTDWVSIWSHISTSDSIA